MVFRNFQGHLCRVVREVMQLGVLWIALGTGRKSSPVAYLMVGQRVDRREDLPSAEKQNQSDCQRRVSQQPAPVSIWASTQLTGNKQCLARTSEKEPSPSVFPEVTLKRPATTSPLFSNILELILSCAY
jgi:hypothetical protein